MERFRDVNRSIRERAEDLCSRLTLREKVGQLHQQLYGFECVQREGDDLRLSEAFKAEVQRFGGLGFLYGLTRADPWTKRGRDNGLSGRHAVRAYNMVQRCVMEHSRFGIPILTTSEYSHGNVMVDGYMLPVNLAVGCTFHPDLLRAAGRICGRQLKATGMWYANISMLDILRDPRWGRSEECYGEDPCLASAFARAIIEGMHSEGMAVIAKHLCAQGETTGGINASPARIGERELREIHLPAVQAACEAGVDGFMAAYNEIDGIPCHANGWLLRTLLREEYGFRGIVTADGCAIDRLDALTGDNVKSGAMALEAGVDVGLWDGAFRRLDEAVERGYGSEARLDEAVVRVLEAKLRCGLFDHPLLAEDEAEATFHYVRFPQSLRLARESLVLLKNDGMLPLRLHAGQRLAVIGPCADDVYRQMGDYTPPMEREQCTTLWDGLSSLCPEGVEIALSDGRDLDRAASLAGWADAVVLALGGSSSRFHQVTFDQTGAAVEGASDMDCGEGVDVCHLRLPSGQNELFRAVRGRAARVATVLVAGRPYAIGDIARQSNALLCAFYPGPCGGQAVGEALWGVFSPSGRLSVSFPHSADQLPVFYNRKQSDRARVYADARDQGAPLFSFGEGFGYSTMEYADVELIWLAPREAKVPADDTPILEVRFTVSNTGGMEDAAVPMLFLVDMEADVTRRCMELKGFTKVAVPAGESRAARIRLCGRDLAIWNRSMRFEVQPGTIQLILKDGNQIKWKNNLLIPEEKQKITNKKL